MRSIVLAILAIAFTAITVAAQPPARVVVTNVFEKEVAPTTPFLGIVDFDIKSGISSEISGLIERQAMVEGSVVAEKDLLVRLNTDFIQKDRDMIAKEIDQLDVRIANARKNLKRLETLFKQNVTTEKDYDDLEALLRELITQREALDVRLAKKALELEKAEIRAPFNALVVARYKYEGEWVSPGVSVGQLAAVDAVVASVAVSEDLVRYIRIGQTLELVVTALDLPLSGKVRTIVPRLDEKSKTFTVKIGIGYREGLLQNMTTRVHVPTAHPKTLRMIKRDALVRLEGKTFVYTVEDAKAKLLPIRIVALRGEYMGVDEPYIVAGMPIVVDGNERLRPDQAVEVIESPTAAAKEGATP